MTGRELLHSVLICQHIGRGYQRQHISPRCILKIYLQKALDSIHWGFLKEMLEALKFPSTFTKWIMACVTSVKFTIHINSKYSRTFDGGKGLRQRDPLSPLLFVICMEYLSRLMKGLGQKSDFELGPTHLVFADDLIMFCKAYLAYLQHTMYTWHEFQECVGLKANLKKSQMVFGGCSHELQNKCMKIIEVQESTFPLKYLGVPIIASRLTKIEYRGLVEKITATVKIWALRSPSFAGRAVSINNVIFGMFNYWASIFILPAKVVVRIKQLCKNYLWSRTNQFKRVPHISWQHTCFPKAKGGLGLKEYTDWNKVIIAKLVWVVTSTKDILWVKWVHGRYIKG